MKGILTIIGILALAVSGVHGAEPWFNLGRVDVKPDGSPSAQPDQHGFAASISDDGRWVIFHSGAADLVPGDTNGLTDIFARDFVSGSTTRLSMRPDGSQTTGASLLPSASFDGRYVLFLSGDDQFVTGDTNSAGDQFLLDRDADGDGIFDNGGETILRISVDDSGGQLSTGANGVRGDVSDDGQVAVFATLNSIGLGDNNGQVDVYVRDLVVGTTQPASISNTGGIGDGPSPAFFAAPIELDADGNRVGFNSEAENFVASDSNGGDDVFVRDQAAGQTLRASVGAGGAQIDRDTRRFSLSRDGKWVALEQFASLIEPDPNPGGSDIYLHELATGAITPVNFSAAAFAKPGASGCCGNQFPLISTNANVVAFQSSQNFTFELGGFIRTSGRSDAFVTTRLGITQLTDFPVPAAADDGWSAFPVGMSSNGVYLLVGVSSASNDVTPEEGLFLYQRDVIFVGDFD